MLRLKLKSLRDLLPPLLLQEPERGTDSCTLQFQQKNSWSLQSGPKPRRRQLDPFNLGLSTHLTPLSLQLLHGKLRLFPHLTRHQTFMHRLRRWCRGGCRSEDHTLRRSCLRGSSNWPSPPHKPNQPLCFLFRPPNVRSTSLHHPLLQLISFLFICLTLSCNKHFASFIRTVNTLICLLNVFSSVEFGGVFTSFKIKRLLRNET